MNASLTIGQLASAVGVNIQTVRYYERRGLVPRPGRTPSGYRQYNADAVTRLRFIKRAQDLGFSLQEIADLFALRVQHASACAAVESKALEKIEVIEAKTVEASADRVAAARWRVPGARAHRRVSHSRGVGGSCLWQHVVRSSRLRVAL